ncbi:MAG TPA: TIGR03086 family metal-binding protein [Mycobacteriales bacterium]|nr:TIGR03086 family metal-binding protein [Mycobacteriales bacterium]
MEVFEALDRSRMEFASRLPLLAADDWPRPTPCSEWDVWALVNHVIGGCRRYTLLLHGATPDETNALRALDHIGADPAASFRAVADEMTAAFREPGALDRVVHHPAGDRSGLVLAGMRVVDFTVHAWDLSRGIGADERLDPDLVEWCRTALSAMGQELSASGFFQPPEGEVPPDATLQDRLLHLTGRTP